MPTLFHSNNLTQVHCLKKPYFFKKNLSRKEITNITKPYYLIYES